MKPLKFNALLKSTLWGGDKIIPFKHLDINQENVGESWEISGVPGNETVVSDGDFKGKKLNEVVAELKGKLVGEDNYTRFGDEFPLLIKFIDARVRTSPYRYIPPTRLPSNRARSAVRQRCGICSIPTGTPLFFVD